jgi:hypothetical protein
LIESTIIFNLDGSKVRFYHLFLILLQFQFISLAHGTAELSGSINFNTQTINDYIEHKSALAESWKMDDGGSSFFVPGNSHQQFGSSAFKIVPKFSSSKLTLTFVSLLNPVTAFDLSSCNFYILADRQKLILSDATQTTLISSSLELNIPKNAQFIEIGILPPPKTTFNCNLKLSSIALEQRTDSSDLDNDGIEDDKDNCPATENPKQLDNNFDGLGDDCTFDRSQYFSSDMPTECQNSSSIGPDNDADGIPDLCDSDDDNDTISDLNELHWGMDVFTAFDFALEKDTDHDNDGLLSTDEIELGYSPFLPNYPPTANLSKYLLNHDDSLQTTDIDSDLVYQYTSNDNRSFSHRTNAVSQKYDLTNQLLLTKNSVKSGDSENNILANFEYAFEPNIVIFTSPTLIDHEYKISTLTTVTYIDHLTQERIETTALASIVSKINLSENNEILSFSYTLHVYDNETSELVLMNYEPPTSWNETEGFIGVGWSNNYTPLIMYTASEPKVDDINKNENSFGSNSGGAFNLAYLLLTLAISAFYRITRLSGQYVKSFFN